MSIRLRLLLLTALPALVICALGAHVIWQNRTLAKQMHQMQQLVYLSEAISQLVHETQKERGNTAGFIGSQGQAFGSQLATQRKATDERVASLQAALQAVNDQALPQALTARLSDANRRLEQLTTTRQAISSLSTPLEDALGFYTTLNADLLNAIAGMAPVSRDAALAVNLVAYGSFLKSKERMGIERAVLTNTFAADRFAPGMFEKLLTLIAEQDSYLDSFRSAGTPQSLDAFEHAAQQPVFAQVQAMRQTAIDRAETGGFGIDAGDWFGTITQKINTVKTVEDALSAELLNAVDQKTSAANTRFVAVLSALLLTAVGLIGFAGWIIRRIGRGFGRLIEAIGDIQSNHDLTRQIKVNTNDELGVLGKHFNTLIRTLHDIIIQVRLTSHQVASAATEVSTSSQDVSAGINEQSDRIHQMSAAIEQMSSSVQMVADQAQRAAQDAQHAGDVAKQGQAVVKQTVTGMEGIDRAVSASAESVTELGRRGEQIGAVIQTINEIAEQTNLLALNAAIEAARAGEHGRGFAVVADEVRKLADRTTQATEEIGGSITAIQSETHAAVDRMQRGTQQVAEGVTLAGQAGDSLKAIVASAVGLGSDVTSIASSSQEQAMVARDVANNIDAINNVAVRSKEQTQMATQAANDLSQRAQMLQSLVERFRTDHA